MPGTAHLKYPFSLFDLCDWYIPTYIATCSQEGRTRQRLKMFQLNEQIRMIPLRA